MDACLNNVYTKVGRRLVAVDDVLAAHVAQCAIRLDESESKKKKKRKTYSGY